MPIKTFPITVSDTTDTKLTITLTFTPDGTYPVDIARSINIVVVNGTLVELSPFEYVPITNTSFSIVDMIGQPTVILTDPTGTWISNFTLTNLVLIPYTRAESTVLLPKYDALHNYYNGSGDITDDRNYSSPFNTVALNLTEQSVLDLKLQPAYDGSVNMIWTDDSNPMRIVNSRFAVSKRYKISDLVADGTTSIDLYGGDCYLGLSWKQVWHPLGIAEAPQTNDITAYKTTRRALGHSPYRIVRD